MKQDKDWTDVMRNALRDAELPPPEHGWARLEAELRGVRPEVSAGMAGRLQRADRSGRSM